jgi:hypothetical protein
MDSISEESYVWWHKSVVPATSEAKKEPVWAKAWILSEKEMK